MASLELTGKCDACGHRRRLVTRIESGQWVCRFCMREFRPPRAKNLATLEQIAQLRAVGLDVSDNLTKREYQKLLRPADDHALEDKYEAIFDSPDKVRHLFTKAAGVVHCNQDGSSRQAIIERCCRLESLTLHREPDNPHDPNAVAVLRANGEQIGYLYRELAKVISHRLELGYRYVALVTDLLRDGGYEPIVRVSVLLIIADPDVSDEQVQEYVDSLDLSV